MNLNNLNILKRIVSVSIKNAIQKGNISMYFNLLTNRKNQLLDQEKELTELLQNLPEGNLYCVKNGKYYRWDLYLNKDNRKTISKKESELAEELALKHYYVSQLKDIKKEEKAIDAYLKKHKDKNAVRQLLLNPEFYRLLKPHLKIEDEALADWMEEPYEKNLQHSENLIHEILPGCYVRSKSEALISTFLNKNKIPFHYEEELRLGNKIIYPDFTIRHPKTGAMYYWEHFGMWDDKNYCKSACSKIQLYAEHGIIPSIQLITTYETAEHPLTVAKIEKTIEEFFFL